VVATSTIFLLCN